jgi:inner membrane protein
MLGAVVPDFDIFWSGMSKKLSDRFAQAGILFLPSIVLLAIGALVTGYKKHRTITHSVVGLGLFVIGLIISLSIVYFLFDMLIFKLAMVWALTGLVGYILHLVEDAMTVSGIPLFLPYSEKHFYVLPEKIRVKTGTWMEGIFLLSFLGVCFLLYFCFIPVWR